MSTKHSEPKSLREYFDIAAALSFKASASDTNVMVGREAILPITVKGMIDGMCNSIDVTNQYVRTGIILHGFNRFKSHLDSNDTLSSIIAQNEIHQCFGSDWNKHGLPYTTDMVSDKRHITFKDDTKDTVRGYLKFRIDASTSNSIEKIFSILRLHRTDGYAICIFFSLVDIDSCYRDFISSRSGMILVTTSDIKERLMEDAESSRRWIIDCDMKTLEKSMSYKFITYKDIPVNALADFYEADISRLLKGCSTAIESTKRIGLDNVSRKFADLINMFTPLVYNISSERKNHTDDILHVSTKADPIDVVNIDESPNDEPNKLSKCESDSMSSQIKILNEKVSMLTENNDKLTGLESFDISANESRNIEISDKLTGLESMVTEMKESRNTEFDDKLTGLESMVTEMKESRNTEFDDKLSGLEATVEKINESRHIEFDDVVSRLESTISELNTDIELDDSESKTSTGLLSRIYRRFFR